MMGTAEFKVGLFVAVCIAIVILMSLKVNVDPSVAGKTKNYSLMLPDANGLVKNSNVKMAGIPIGIISDISLSDGKAKIIMTLQSNIRLTKSASAEIRPNGVLGDKYIEMYPGDANDEVLGDGGLISKYQNNSSMDSMVNKVGKIADDVASMTQALKKATTGEGDDDSPLGRILHNMEDVTADLREVSDNKKDKLAETIDNLHGLTQTLNEFMSDGGEDGFEQNWKKMVNSLARVESILRNMDEVAGKINKGEGSIGKLVNDETTVEELNHAVHGVNNMLDTASKIQLSMDYHSELMAGALTKSYIGVNVQPGPDRYYLVQLIDDPKGSYERIDQNQTLNGGTPSTTTTQTVYHNKFKFSAQFAKIFYNFTIRAGMFESSAGIGFDLAPIGKKLKFTSEIFGLGRSEGLDLRAYAKYKFYSVFYVTAGGDDILNTRGNSLTGTGASGFIGAGLDFTNDDLKLLLTKGF